MLLGSKLGDGQEVDFSSYVLSVPQEQFGSNKFDLTYTNGFTSAKIGVVTQESAIAYGQFVHIVGRVKSKVLGNNNTVYTIYSPRIEAKDSLGSIPLYIAQQVREKVQRIYAHALGQDEAALLLGVVLGVKSPMSQTLLSAFKTTGVMHVIAASGMNVTLVGAFLVGLLGKWMRRQYVGILTISVIALYCLLAGLQPSIVRAGIMASFALIGQLYGRQYSGWYGLFLAGCIMLLLNPILIFDVGFQLSFTASLGILVIQPLISSRFLGGDVATSLSAQIATLPILLGVFGQYGVLSILVNALVLWTVAPLMILGGIGAIIGLVWQPLGSGITLLTLPLLFYFEKVVLFFDSFHLLWTVGELPMVLILGYYGIMASISWFAWNKRHEEMVFAD